MWFEDNSQYTVPDPVPEEFVSGSLSLVRVYPNGKTQPGWGTKEFIDSWKAQQFLPTLALFRYHKYQQPFAFVMRGIPFICVDIDGKNGGMQTAQILELPPTLAETSKSGNGYHLYYSMSPTTWNPTRGFDEFPDLIGLIPGVDIKGTGVVYHYPNQRWNGLEIAPIPVTLGKLIRGARDAKAYSRKSKGASNLDPEELVLLHDDLKAELAGEFRAGNRNNKLFAIGAQMYNANYPHWDVELYDRGFEIGLEEDEISNMITNIEKYS